MKRFISSLSVLCVFSLTLAGQDTTYQPPSNLRYEPQPVWWQVDEQVKLIWTPPVGWVHSAVDRWYDWDRGIWDGNSIGSCTDCPWEAAARWDAAMINMYDSVYLTKIRYMLIEPQVSYRLRVYQGTPGSFDTLVDTAPINIPVYKSFDTLTLQPILLDITKDLWIGYWVSNMSPGYPLPVGPVPAVEGYGNMIKFDGQGWTTLTFINPALSFNWSIGGYLETPNDTIIYPVFNVYRAINDEPFEKINQEQYLDTIYYDFIKDIDASHIYYYVTCVYADGESGPSDIVDISLVNISEKKESAFKIFPNPATDHVSIESVRGRINSISLIDSQGSVVIEKIVGDKRIDLDISHLNSSIYIIKIITEEGMFTSKLLVVK